jgi:hypothetical protein
LLRSIPLPSFLSTKRGKLLTAAAAGTVTLATALSLVAVTAPSSAAPAPTDAAAFMTSVGQPGGHITQATDLALYQPSQATLIASSKAAASKATVVKVTTEAKAQAAKAAAEKKAAAAKAAAVKAAAVKAAAAKAAAVRAAAPATQAAQAAPAAPAAPAAAPSGTPQQIAQQMLSQYGWSASQFSCLQPLWYHESGWSVTAENPSSGAYGIPQALPASQMASAGPDWQTNPATQIKWGLNYIQQRYGSPCGAWAHEQSAGWY